MSGRRGPPCLLRWAHKQTESYKSYMTIQKEQKFVLCHFNEQGLGSD